MKLILTVQSLVLTQLLSACNEAPPVATEYKKQLCPAGPASSSDGKAKGLALLDTQCKGCHNGDTAVKLGSTEVAAIQKMASGQGDISGHGAGINKTIKDNSADLICALGGSSGTPMGEVDPPSGEGNPPPGAAGVVAVGMQVVTTTCSNCHGAGKTQAALTKASAAGVDAAGKRPSHATVAPSFMSNAADIKAYLNTL